VLCELVAKELGADTLPLFTRVGGREQKKLTKAERAKNIRSSIILNENLSGFPKKINVSDLSAAISGKTVIIIDDVITSGATMKHSAGLIRKCSTNQKVFIACVAKTATETAANVE
jgi:predicted amidophosphoribosyltransferase